MYGQHLVQATDHDEVPGWGVQDRPDPDRAGDMLEVLGICNYLTEGVLHS
jgi:hypothetical protein